MLLARTPPQIAMFLAALALAFAPALSQEDPEAQYEAFLQEFIAELDFQEGEVTVHDGDVMFDLPEGWALLNRRDARAVVEDLWGNPADTSTVAFIDPPSPDGRLGSSYGIIVTVDESGYVKDEDS